MSSGGLVSFGGQAAWSLIVWGIWRGDGVCWQRAKGRADLDEKVLFPAPALYIKMKVNSTGTSLGWG